MRGVLSTTHYKFSRTLTKIPSIPKNSTLKISSKRMVSQSTKIKLANYGWDWLLTGSSEESSFFDINPVNENGIRKEYSINYCSSSIVLLFTNTITKRLTLVSKQPSAMSTMSE